MILALQWPFVLSLSYYLNVHAYILWAWTIGILFMLLLYAVQFSLIRPLLTGSAGYRRI